MRPTARPRPCIGSSPRRCRLWSAQPWALQSCPRCSGACSQPWLVVARPGGLQSLLCALLMVCSAVTQLLSLRRSPSLGSPGPPSCKQGKGMKERQEKTAATRRNTQRGGACGGARAEQTAAQDAGVVSYLKRSFASAAYKEVLGCRASVCEPFRQCAGRTSLAPFPLSSSVHHLNLESSFIFPSGLCTLPLHSAHVQSRRGVLTSPFGLSANGHPAPSTPVASTVYTRWLNKHSQVSTTKFHGYRMHTYDNESHQRPISSSQFHQAMTFQASVNIEAQHRSLLPSKA